MSTRRVGLSAWQWDKKYGIEHGPNGFRLCRLCKTETTYKRATLCSEACQTQWALMTSPGYARSLVYQRDKGICVLCDLDTDMLVKMIREPGRAYSLFSYRDRPRSRARWHNHDLMRSRESLWDADHIVPVVEGGGECDLDNLRTLCIWCHRRETAALAARRANARSRQGFAEKRARVLGTTVDEQLSYFAEVQP